MNCILCSGEDVAPIAYERCQVYVCARCGLQFLEESADASDYYEGYYDRFRGRGRPEDELRRKQYEIDARHFSAYIDHGIVLDVGCSNAGFMEALAQVGEYELHGIDPDRPAITAARERLSGSGMTFEVGDLVSFIPPKQYDAVVFRGTFQYLGTTLMESMKKMITILAKDGKLIIYSQPNSDSFLYYLFKDKWHLFHSVEHRLIFNEKSLRYLCEVFQLDLLELSYPYLDTPYANLREDYAEVVKAIRGGPPKGIPFWGSIIQTVMQH